MPDLKPGYNLIRAPAPHGEEALFRQRACAVRCAVSNHEAAPPSRRGEDAAPQMRYRSGKGVDRCLKKACWRESGYWLPAGGPGSGARWGGALAGSEAE